MGRKIATYSPVRCHWPYHHRNDKKHDKNQTEAFVKYTSMNDPAIITGIFTLGGVAIGSLATFLISFRTTKLENQKHIRELGLQLATTHFEYRMKEVQAIAEATGTNMEVQSLSIFVVEGIKMAEIICDPKLNAWEMGKRLAGLTTITKTVQSGIDAHK